MVDIDWHRLPPLTTLRAFEATGRLQGYSAAARALNVTPAAIAQQVRKLESEMGVSLVRREGRGLVLTSAGEDFARDLRDAFSVIARSYDDIRQKDAETGVRVSTTDLFGQSVVLPRLGDFWAKHPMIQVSFSPEGNAQPVDLERFDIVIRGAGSGQKWFGMQEVKLLETPMIYAAAPTLIEGREPDLSKLPWIKDKAIGGTVFEEMVRSAGCDPEKIELVDPGSAKFELDAALMGYGILAWPELTLRKHLESGQLIRLRTSQDMTGVYYAIHRKGPLSEPVRQFLEWLVPLCALSTQT